MNALEQEYRDNLQRVKRREDRRRVIGFGLYGAIVFVVYLAYLIRGEATLRDTVLMLPIAALCAGFSLVRLARFFMKRFEDRDVEVATTERERERGYREPVAVIAEEGAPPAKKPGLLAMVALIPLGAAALVIGVLLRDRRDRLVSLGITVMMMGLILAGQRLYGTWRARRNARLELQWEKWLDSADSCEVGPRKWTK